MPPSTWTPVAVLPFRPLRALLARARASTAEPVAAGPASGRSRRAMTAMRAPWMLAARMVIACTHPASAPFPIPAASSVATRPKVASANPSPTARSAARLSARRLGCASQAAVSTGPIRLRQSTAGTPQSARRGTTPAPQPSVKSCGAGARVGRWATIHGSSHPTSCPAHLRSRRPSATRLVPLGSPPRVSLDRETLFGLPMPGWDHSWTFTRLETGGWGLMSMEPLSSCVQSIPA